MSAGTTTWHFVRHGESEANAQGWVAGHVDARLTAAGVAQAEALRPRLAALRPGRVVASDLVRARRTAELAWGDRTPALELHPELRERHLGAWERAKLGGLRRDGRIRTLYSWGGAPPDGESQRMLSRRVLTWLAAHDDGTETLLFVHGGLIRCVVGLADGTDPEQIGFWKVKNTEWVPRTLPTGRWAELLEELP
jgi:broad specificity phosphatase PhoE